MPGTGSHDTRFSRGMEDERHCRDQDVRPRFSRVRNVRVTTSETTKALLDRSGARAPHPPSARRAIQRGALACSFVVHNINLTESAADDRSVQRVGGEPRCNGRSRVIADGMFLPVPGTHAARRAGTWRRR